MPSLKPLLSKIRQLSARTAYEAESTTPFDWKKLAFRHVLHDHCQQLDANESLNAISFGDSLHERVAILSLAKELQMCREDCTIKSVKFMDRPEIDDLKKQHDLIVTCFPWIVDSKEDLDLCLKSVDP
eukprot:GHVU01016648.1.p3 GENE.GHVU01016648.1~~GHVU01016648.1.p3  ORF type:complete len:128 (-),score=23.01 GHVU01016648.1:218-601(-)